MHEAVYVYAIASRDYQLASSAEGLCGAPLLITPWRGLAAVVSVFAESRIPATSENLLSHEETVEALLQAGPALPVRFGALFSDHDAVIRALDRHYDSLVGELARVGGKVEMGVTLLWESMTVADEPLSALADHSEASIGRQGPGARHMVSRLARRRRELTLQEKAKALSRQLDTAVEGEALERHHTILPTARLAVRAAYLVEPSRLDAFRLRLGQWKETHPNMRILVSGPWPPYSFVGGTQVTSARAAD